MLSVPGIHAYSYSPRRTPHLFCLPGSTVGALLYLRKDPALPLSRLIQPAVHLLCASGKGPAMLRVWRGSDREPT